MWQQTQLSVVEFSLNFLLGQFGKKVKSFDVLKTPVNDSILS